MPVVKPQTINPQFISISDELDSIHVKGTHPDPLSQPKTVEKSIMSDDHLDQATNATSEFPSPVGEGQGEAEYKPKLIVRTHQTENTVTLEIEDNGPGIPKEMKDKIMQPFFTTKKGTQGTGVGLSITNDIIKAHGGTVILKKIN
jgi:hypothetical protein